jgi:hypothetical protein
VAPERITVTCDRHDEPIVFGAVMTERAKRSGCTVVDYVRADLAEGGEQLDALREAVRGFLIGAPLREDGRFQDARLETLYRAAGLER